MTSPGFTIDVNVERALIVAAVNGLWDEATLNRYQHDLSAAIDRAASARSDRPCVSILVDARLSGVQSQNVSNGLRTFALGNQNLVWRAAIVSPSALHRLQVQRGNPELNRQFFGSIDEAMAWLGEDKVKE